MTTTTKIPLKHIALLFTILFFIQYPVAAIVTQDGSVEYQPNKHEITYDIALPAETTQYQADEMQHNIQQNAQDRIKINQNTREVFDTQNPSKQQTQESTNDWIHIQSSSNSDTFAYNHPLSKTESLEKSTQESITDSLVKNTANTYNTKNTTSIENPPEIDTQENWFYWKIALVIIVIILIILMGTHIYYEYTNKLCQANRKLTDTNTKLKETRGEFIQKRTEFRQTKAEFVQKTTDDEQELRQIVNNYNQALQNYNLARDEYRQARIEHRQARIEYRQARAEAEAEQPVQQQPP
jgi:uncharacterized membrane-anchored protein YhcB (DUF1043 family)